MMTTPVWRIIPVYRAYNEGRQAKLESDVNGNIVIVQSPDGTIEVGNGYSIYPRASLFQVIILQILTQKLYPLNRWTQILSPAPFPQALGSLPNSAALLPMMSMVVLPSLPWS